MNITIETRNGFLKIQTVTIIMIAMVRKYLPVNMLRKVLQRLALK